MNRFVRRSFLRQIAVGLGLVGINTTMPATTGSSVVYAQTITVEDLNKDDIEQFFEGKIVKAEPDRLVVATPDKTVTLLVTPQTQLWKGGFKEIRNAGIEVGDFCYARALPLDATIDAINFAATRIWVNIVNLHGVARDIQSNNIQLAFPATAQQTRQTLTVYFDSDTLLNEVPRIDATAFKANQLLQVVGVYQKDGSVRATRLWTTFD
jgi:hypothetical protein